MLIKKKSNIKKFSLKQSIIHIIFYVFTVLCIYFMYFHITSTQCFIKFYLMNKCPKSTNMIFFLGVLTANPIFWHALHTYTEKSFRKLIKSTRNQIVFTIFRLIWIHRTSVCCSKSIGKCLIQSDFNLI